MSLRYKWTPDIMTYVTVSRGFKTGSFQVAPVYTTDVYAVNPEKTTNYEIGLKGQFFDRMLGVDLTAYHIDIDDQQLQSARVVGNITTSAITNASSSEVDGAELDVTWRPSAFFSLSANAAYTDARFTDYQIYTGGRLVDLSGDAFPNTPKLAYQVAAQYIVPFSKGDLVFDASYRYFDDIHVGTGTGSSDAIHPVPDWNRTDLSATWQTGNWAIKGYVQNLTDEYIILSSWRSFQVQPTNNYWHSRVAAPRTYGLSVAYTF
jgi:iron complex outermembrane receptor protein